jgi:hypothetical protein
MYTLKIEYNSFLTIKGNLPAYYVTFGGSYLLICVSSEFVYVCKLDDETNVSDFETNHKSSMDEVGSKEDAVALASILSRTNTVTPRTTDGKEVVTVWPAEGAKITFYSFNWADRTTWYYRAVRVVDETATVQGEGYTTYKVPNVNLIDTFHGKISGEDFITDAQGNSYRVVVKVNDVVKEEQDPHLDSGGDYTIDYAAGTITFLSALDSDAIVLVTYHYEDGSEWSIVPEPGKVLKIRKVEVQFSEDIVLTDSILFQPYGPVEIWAPQLVDNPYPIGTRLPLGNPDVLKTMSDYINDANGAFPSIPILSGSNWRGTKSPTHIFQWDYQTLTDVRSSKGVEVRLKLEHDTPFGGSLAVATFYCLSEDE